MPVVIPLEELQVRMLTDSCFGHTTVGCVAMDYQGNLARGTSTGGITGMENNYLL